MIPKIIHYCWFGPNLKPNSVEKFIKDWKEKLPDYEIIEWNESNFDIECCDYVKQAYKAKKFAFVSDYARLKALYEHGGIYLDTDVEVFKDLTPLLSISDTIFGFEEVNYIATSTMLSVPKNRFIKYFLDSYHSRSFIGHNGKLDMTTNVEKLSKMLECIGLIKNNCKQQLKYHSCKITILPQEYLSPYDYINCYDKSTGNSYTKHHFDISWGKKREWFKKYIKTLLTKLFGRSFLIKIRKIFQ